MKKYIQLAPLMMLLFLFLIKKASYCQTSDLPKENATITMNDGNKIIDVHLWAVHTSVLEYEKNGNLHDAVISEIKKVETATDELFFDSTGTLKSIASDLILTTNNDSIKCSIEIVNNACHYIGFRRIVEKENSTIAFQRIKKYFIKGVEYPLSARLAGGGSIPIPDTSSSAVDTVSVFYGDGNFYKTGEEDAAKYYDGSGAFIGGLFSGAVPVFGWFVGLPVLASTDPQMMNYQNPHLNMLANKDYHEGYLKKAKKKKIASVCGGFGIGALAFLALIL